MTPADPITLLAEATEIILEEREALVEGLTIFATGKISDDPADAPARATIARMDAFLDTALAFIGAWRATIDDTTGASTS
jgi:hypothetical protein